MGHNGNFGHALPILFHNFRLILFWTYSNLFEATVEFNPKLCILLFKLHHNLNIISSPLLEHILRFNPPGRIGSLSKFGRKKRALLFD